MPFDDNWPPFIHHLNKIDYKNNQINIPFSSRVNLVNKYYVVVVVVLGIVMTGDNSSAMLRRRARKKKATLPLSRNGSKQLSPFERGEAVVGRFVQRYI